MPPLMSPESAEPSIFKTGLNNFQQGMSDSKNRVAAAMLAQQLTKAAQGFATPKLMAKRADPFDLYGNYRG